MLKNVIIKKILKKTICKLLSVINNICWKNDRSVLLYISLKGVEFNLGPVFQYLIEKKFNEKYTIYHNIEHFGQNDEKIKNVRYIGKLKAFILFFFSKHVFYTAGQIPIKPSKKQCVLHLSHGAVYYKSMGAISNINNGDEFFFSKMLVTGERYKEIVKKAYKCEDENLFICNEPMTDLFYNRQLHVSKNGDPHRMVLWLPTFRQSAMLGYDNSDNSKPLLLFDESDYDSLDAFLNERNIKIIVKLHPAQTSEDFLFKSYSSLQIFNHSQFRQMGYDVYELMCQSIALIGDYSTTSLQYLLLDKPMAYVIPDLEDYKQKRGFVFENPLEYMPGNIVTTKEEFYQFIEEICQGIDAHKAEREKVRNEIHYYQDGNACKRVVEASGLSL